MLAVAGEIPNVVEFLCNHGCWICDGDAAPWAVLQELLQEQNTFSSTEIPGVLGHQTQVSNNSSDV